MLETGNTEYGQDSTASPPVLDNFIVLEGLDGSGTTTQLKLIDIKLNELSIPHFCTSEPTDGFIGAMIRSILEHRSRAHPKTIALLFAADRNEHLWNINNGIVSRLERGELVICDRYLFSSLAYQSPACGFEYVYSLNRGFPLPQHLIFLDTPVGLSQKRLSHRAGREKELFDSVKLQPEILTSYQRAFGLFTDTDMKFHRLDGTKAPETVFDKFWNILQTLPMVKE